MRGAIGLGSRILLFRPGRFVAACAGIAVAMVIMFIQIGFFFGVLDSQAHITELVRGDLVVMSIRRTHLNKWSPLDRIRLNRIAALPGVVEVVPIYKGGLMLRNPRTGAARRIIGYAFKPDSVPLYLGGSSAITATLKQARSVLFDTRSRAIYGAIRHGDDIELDGHSYRIGGFVSMGPNIINDGAIFMSDGEWRRIRRDDQPVMGVIRVTAETDLAHLQSRISDLFGVQVAVFTPHGLREREVWFTLRAAPISLIFGIGVIAGLVIGVSICYQVLFNLITDNRAQYATLKGMGFGASFLAAVVIEQALLLALSGSIPGLAVSALLFNYIGEQTALIMRLTMLRTALVITLTCTMCVVAALLAMRRIGRLEPAELF